MSEEDAVMMEIHREWQGHVKMIGDSLREWFFGGAKLPSDMDGRDQAERFAIALIARLSHAGMSIEPIDSLTCKTISQTEADRLRAELETVREQWESREKFWQTWGMKREQ